MMLQEEPLASASTLDKEIKTKHSNKEAAKEVGALIAKKSYRKKKYRGRCI